MDEDYLAFFKSEVSNESAAIRIGAVNKLNLIASALGSSRTETELVPYLTKVVKEPPFLHDEEFLFSVAKQYAVLDDFVSGNGALFIAPLEHLAAQEETVIRDQAILSLCKIVDNKPELAKEHLVPALHRLAQSSDFFTARVSACGLLPTTYKNAAEDQKDGLRKAYTQLCADDTPMVRRAAANKLRDFIAVCDKNDTLSDMISVYKSLSQEDTQDTIRVACVLTTLEIARVLNTEENRQHTLQVVKEAAEDRSWRVRLTVAKNFNELCTNLGPEIRQTDLMAPFLKLLSDNEQEVRKEAIRVIEPCLANNNFTQEQLKEHLLPQFQSLGNDAGQPVRAALAAILGPVAKALGRDVTQRELFSLISQMMKDEFYDVRLNIVGHAGLLCEVLSDMADILQQIQNLIMDNHWRIRQSVVEQVPKFAKHFGVDMFQSKLEALFLASLRDSVHSVRLTAINQLKDICETFGRDWTVQHLFPKLNDQYSQDSGYANRVTTLCVLPQVAAVMSPDQIAKDIVPLVVKATKDPVPNVRFCACRTITELWKNKHDNFPQATINSTVKPALLELEQDSDVDVKFFAQQALKNFPGL